MGLRTIKKLTPNFREFKNCAEGQKNFLGEYFGFFFLLLLNFINIKNTPFLLLFRVVDHQSMVLAT